MSSALIFLAKERKTMNNASCFLEKLRRGQVCFGTCMTSTDPTLTEALCQVLDVIWVDTEHAPISIETVQLHAMAVARRTSDARQ